MNSRNNLNLLVEDWQLRLEQMRKIRLGTTNDSRSVPASYRSPGPAQAVAGSNLNIFKPRNGMAPSPMSGRGPTKLYKPKKPASVISQAPKVSTILNK